MLHADSAARPTSAKQISVSDVDRYLIWCIGEAQLVSSPKVVYLSVKAKVVES